MPKISVKPNVEETKIVKELPLLAGELGVGARQKNAIKEISLDTAYALARMGNVARERLYHHVNRGEKWALELYFKIFTQLFDKSWLSRIDLTDIQTKIDNKDDKDEIIRVLMNKLLSVGTIEVNEAKDIVKMLTTMSLNDKLSHSIASKMADEDVIKVMTMINAVKEGVQWGFDIDIDTNPTHTPPTKFRN